MADQVEQISLDLIDEPTRPVRSQMDDESINELAADIKRNGLIEPIILVRRGERFEVVAGHRRFNAFKRTGGVTIPSIVRVLTDQEALQIKISENLYRQDIDLLDEAAFYAELITDLDMTVPLIAQAIGRSEYYVQSRLDIVMYPPEFQQALAEKKISLGVAQALVTVDDERERTVLLEYAIKDGVSVQNAKNWAVYYEAQKQTGAPQVFREMAPEEVREIGRPVIACARCLEGADMRELMQVWIHRGNCPVREKVKVE